jgi:spermidine synthase
MESTTAAANNGSIRNHTNGLNGHMKKKKPQSISNGWYTEIEPSWPGQSFSLALEEFSEEKSILFYETSEFQNILVFRSAQHGNVLVLDGVVQLTEDDEFIYQEMITHLPLMIHPNPINVLIVGGGDGGVLREVCRHSCVQEITLVEIDQMVIDVAKRFFGDSTATAFDDDRVLCINEDAAEFLKKHNEKNAKKYDIIIADSSDPVGPAATLFDPLFYEQMHEALNEGGVICAQGECFWTNPDLIVNVVACCADVFDTVEYASTMVPTYPCGQIGFILAGKGEDINLRKPCRDLTDALQSQLKWYNEAIHSASFVLPQFLEKRLASLRPQLLVDNNEDDDEDNDEDDEVNDCFLGQCTIS